MRRAVVRALVALDSERFGEIRLGAQEAHREQDEIRLERLRGAVDVDHLESAVDLLPLHSVDAHADHAAVLAQELFRHDRVTARVRAEASDGFLMRIVRAMDLWP